MTNSLAKALLFSLPFSLPVAVCSSQTHEPWDHGDASKYKPDKITVPAFMFDNQETREALCRYYGEVNYLEQDPYELNNLIASPGYTATAEELIRELKKWMAQQGDLGHETELEVIRKRDAAKEAMKQKQNQ